MRNATIMEEFIAILKAKGIPAEAVTSLEESARQADLPVPPFPKLSLSKGIGLSQERT